MEEWLDDLRVQLKCGIAKIWTPETIEPLNADLIFFDKIPQDLIRARDKAVRSNRGGWQEWWLIRSHPGGREWTDDMCGLGILVIVVEDLEKTHSELAAIKVESTPSS